MDILTEIIEVSDSLIGTLKETGFFEEHIFIEEIPLKLKLQETMQRKWEQEGQMLLTDKEFIKVCDEVMHVALGETLGGLVDKEALEMSIDENGEINYSVNPNFNIDKLIEDDE
jgi:hypothetical protein